MAHTYPLPLARKTNLDDWLDTLTQIPSANEKVRICACCDHASVTSRAFLDQSDSTILFLPCGCRAHRLCLKELFAIQEKNNGHCVGCGFHIFEKWTLEEWMKGLKRIPIERIWKEEAESECGICKVQYNIQMAKNSDNSENEPEQPVALPCNHVFGDRCLQEWLSPDGGNGNDCPLCREKLFPPWPSQDTSEVGDVENPGNGLQAQQRLAQLRAECHRLEERLHWQRYMNVHCQVHNLSWEEAADDQYFMNRRIAEMERNFQEWSDESRQQLAERRARVRQLLMDRVVERARMKSQLALTRLLELESLEEAGNFERALDLASELRVVVRHYPFT